MSLAKILAVDDSHAVLAYVKGALCEHYDVTTVDNGVEALRVIKELAPEIVLLDLSMPQMSGDEVLARLKADPQLKDIPVVVVSSEQRRGEQCVAKGAVAFSPKPVRAAALRTLVERVLSDERRRRERAGLSVLRFRLGGIFMAVPLECVHDVALQPLTLPLGIGPTFLREMVDFHGEPLGVIDLAVRFNVEHDADLADRMLIIVEHGGARVALCVDAIGEAETLEADALVLIEAFGAGNHPPLRNVLRGVTRGQGEPLPVIDPAAFFSSKLLRVLPAAIQKALADRPEVDPR